LDLTGARHLPAMPPYLGIEPPPGERCPALVAVPPDQDGCRWDCGHRARSPSSFLYLLRAFRTERGPGDRHEAVKDL